jgi:two-component system response regulator CpxR
MKIVIVWLKAMDKILLITEDASTAQWFHDGLQKQGFELIKVSNAREGTKTLATDEFILVLFDLSLCTNTNTNTNTNTAELRLDASNFWLEHQQRPWVPVAALSWNNSDSERLDALDLGADIYLKRPFHIKELFLNMAMFKRRSGEHLNGVRRGIDFDDSQCKVMALQREVVLTPTEFSLFKYIFDRNGDVVTKAELQQKVLNRPLGRFDRNLDMHISNTRRKLSQTCLPREWINTVRGQGYRFNDCTC